MRPRTIARDLPLLWITTPSRGPLWVEKYIAVSGELSEQLIDYRSYEVLRRHKMAIDTQKMIEATDRMMMENVDRKCNDNYNDPKDH